MSVHLFHGFAHRPQTASVIALRGGDVFVTDNLLGYERVDVGIDHVGDQRSAKDVVMNRPDIGLLAGGNQRVANIAKGRKADMLHLIEGEAEVRGNLLND